MVWKKFFKKKTPKGLDPLKDLILQNLKTGYYVDYDMKTWEVTTSSYYDWGGREYTYEWQLKSADDTVYLEREPDDEDYWSISRKISINRLDPGIRESIKKQGDPPDEITHENTIYYLDESGGGHFYLDGKEPGKKMLKWDYADDSGNRFISIEQWGEETFEASTGMSVEEYQFTDILPSEKNED